MKTTSTLIPRFLLLLFIIYSAIGHVYANSSYYFKQLSLHEGLTQSTVRCILNDHDGFIWIGTKLGINRFDRHELKSYKYEIGNPNSLPGNTIFFIAEDSLFNIWVGTENGLACYNRSNDTFTPIKYKENCLRVRSFLHLEDGILFGGNGKLFKYYYTTHQIQEVLYKNAEQIVSTFTSLYFWRNNQIVIGTRWNGLWMYDPKKNEIKRADFCAENNIISTFVDSHNYLWVSPYGKGLLCYSPHGELIARYSTENSQLSNNVILDIKEKDDLLWLATDGGGISILDMKKKEFTVIEHIPGNIYSLPVNSIFCLYNDYENNMWVGSIRGGLFGIKKVYIQTYRDVPINNPFGLSEKTVLCLYEEDNGSIWIGTDGGGINRFDPDRNAFKHYPITYKDKVSSITGFNKEELIISIFNKGLFLFNKETGKVRPFTFINENKNAELSQLAISVNVNKSSDNQIQFLADKAYSYNMAEKTYKELKLSSKKTISTSSLHLISSNEYVTYLFGERNIFELNNRTGTMTIVYTQAEYNEIIYSVCRDNKNNFWIGTSKGLIQYNTLSGSSKRIESKLFQGVSSLIYDKNNRIWIGTQGLLFCYVITENKFVLLGESDGASPNEYIARPTLLSKSGDIYMGGVMGLVRIAKGIQFEDTSHLSIELTDILLNGVSVNIADKAEANISIPWNHTSIGIKVMAREEDVFRKKIFRYNIIGLNNQFIESYDHTLTLNTLPAGNYEIMASCSTKDGSWSFPVKVLSLSVTPSWWKSKWFILSVIVFIVGSTVLTIRYVIRKKESKLKWEIKEHEQKSYEEKVRFLINISHELRTPLTLIYAPLKRLLNNNIKDENLNKQLTGIYKQARQMKNIINMVLDIRKMEVGQDALHLKPHLLNEWIRSIADDYQNELEAKNVRLIYDFDKSIQTLSFDENKCENVFSNLLTNAMKFSEPDTTITISTCKAGNMVRISVKDQGIGLSGVDTSKLFTRFYQGNHDRKGNGIGLSYAKILVEMHGGSISAISNEDRGATFYYELPLTNTVEDISCQPGSYLNELLYSPKKTETESLEFSTKEYSLLVVEDEPELLKFLKEALNEHFKKVYTAANGEEALAYIQQTSPDLVISDVMMPKMDGLELCKRIKTNIEISHIPVVLLTARSDSESTSFGYKIGADAYLSKPFDIEFLMILVRNQLRNRDQIKSKYKHLGPVVDPKEITFSNTDEKFLLKLNDIIAENISNVNMDVQFITDKIAMSRASLYNKMKALTNMSIVDYINKFRVEKAIQLLVSTDLNMTEIAEKIGFNNQRYFSTVFKQITEITPSKYREKYRK